MLRTVLVTPSPRLSVGSASAPSGGGVTRDLIPLLPEEAQKDPLLGRNLIKSFGRESFYGLVVGIDVDSTTGERHYHVTYEDEDEEHLLADEVRRLLQPGRTSVGPRQSRSGSPACSPGFGPARPSVAASCRPSFAASRAATPRQSVASRRQSGAPVVNSGQSAVPGCYWVLAGVGLLVYVITSVDFGSAPPLPPDAATASLESAAPWPLPSNDDLFGSLPPSSAAAEALGNAPPWLEATRDVEVSSSETLGSEAAPFSESSPEAPPVLGDGAAAHTWTRLPEPERASDTTSATTLPPAIEESADKTLADVAEACLRMLRTAAKRAEAGVTAGFEMIAEFGRHLADTVDSGALCAILLGFAAATIVLLVGKRRDAGNSGSLVPVLPDGTAATSIPVLPDGHSASNVPDLPGGLTAANTPARNDPYLRTLAASPRTSHPTLPPVLASPCGLALPPASSPVTRVATPARGAPPPVESLRASRRTASPAPVRKSPKATIPNRFCDLPPQRFRYPSALRKMQEMGFQDTPGLRDVISQCAGNVDQAMSNLCEEED